MRYHLYASFIKKYFISKGGQMISKIFNLSLTTITIIILVIIIFFVPILASAEGNFDLTNALQTLNQESPTSNIEFIPTHSTKIFSWPTPRLHNNNLWIWISKSSRFRSLNISRRHRHRSTNKQQNNSLFFWRNIIYRILRCKRLYNYVKKR